MPGTSPATVKSSSSGGESLKREEPSRVVQFAERPDLAHYDPARPVARDPGGQEAPGGRRAERGRA
eukprot:8417524-Lingulodinium_polyedra.AAC.1